ncbi:RHS repeat-associated core domain-containing protein [uncultured Pseudomonas sp.]|uniref:RHS repeat-associated core domain-containing protein n=1 Tax=uncultured Pseudomonas sp. TaxID=114707 RepID=UPI0025F9AB3A|nr:RHS repeat-associated core domain-containing protein [uncultured Pseudomonas sp.]
MSTTSPATQHYHYDALDRLASRSNAERPVAPGFFYCGTRLATEIEGHARTILFHARNRLLAQRRDNVLQIGTTLLGSDQPGSVTHSLSATQQRVFAYMPYGARHPLWVPEGLSGFKGERLEPMTAHYLSGNGYRAFNPVLMRFHSPDSLSPFGEGGLNEYAYCAGDPINRADPEGHMFQAVMTALSDFFPSQSRQKFKVIAPGIIGFEKPYGKRKTFSIVSHGVAEPLDGYHPLITSDERLVSPMILRDRLASSGIDLSQYERIRLMSCYSANGANPFAAQLSKLTQKPVKGYRGVVSVAGSHHIENNRRVRQLSQHEYEYSGQIRAIKISLPGALNERLPFTYKPVIFNP